MKFGSSPLDWLCRSWLVFSFGKFNFYINYGHQSRTEVARSA